MSELHNPLFDDEREFLERQKLEYERALLGDVDHLKQRTNQIGRYAAIGAALLGGFWLVNKVLRGHEDDEHQPRSRRKLKAGKASKSKGKRKPLLVAHSDDYDFGSGLINAPGYHPAPVYHATAAADSDPFPSFDAGSAATTRSIAPVPAPAHTYSHNYRSAYSQHGHQSAHHEPRSSMLVGTIRALAESDTGKMLIGQLSGVLIAVVTRKVQQWMEDVNKNSDLAASAVEPETKDIDFVIHHDDAHAPDAPV